MKSRLGCDQSLKVNKDSLIIIYLSKHILDDGVVGGKSFWVSKIDTYVFSASVVHSNSSHRKIFGQKCEESVHMVYTRLNSTTRLLWVVQMVGADTESDESVCKREEKNYWFDDDSH